MKGLCEVKKRHHLCFTFFILLLTAQTAFPDDSIAATADYAYRRSMGANVDTVFRSLVSSVNEVIITYKDPPNMTSRAQCDEHLSIHSWQFENKETGYDITAKRFGDTIIITGKQGSQPIQKSQVIDSFPWYQAMEFSLLSFLKQRAYFCEFWIISPMDMKAFKMIARRKETESIQVNGQMERAVKITLSSRSLAGQFWYATLWYRADDFRFIKSSMPRGILGRSPTIVETIERKNRNDKQ
jgi:hypothetical protein